MIFLDLFAGIGGFRLALERAGHKCIGFCEIDKFARQTYKANFDTEGEVEWHDITTVTDDDVRQVGRVDIITGGFPCQAFSVAGKRGGFDDTRGTLFFEIARIARILRPRYLLLENVKGLLNHAGGDTAATIFGTLEELGYWWEYQVLNSKDFGVPQNRERVFIIGHSRRFPRREIFPIAGASRQALRELTHGLADAYRVYDSKGLARTIKAEAGGLGAKTGLYAVPNRQEVAVSYGKLTPRDIAMTIDANYHKGFDNRGGRTGVLVSHKTGLNAVRSLGNIYPSGGQNGEVYDLKGLSPTLRSGQGVKGRGIGSNNSPKIAVPVLTPDRAEKPPHIPGPEDINNTVRSGGRGSLTAKHNHDTIHDRVRIRRLTPLECFRLQGFPDSHHDNAKAAGVSDSQLYKQAGNAVTVTVVYEIAKRLG